MKASIALSGSWLLVALVACGPYGGDTDGYGNHGCATQYNLDWAGSGLNLELDHTDPRQCPQNANVGDWISLGARVEDKSATYPNQNASSVDASACDEYATSYWSCIGELGDDYEFMTWDYVASSGTWKHRATLSVSYQAGPSPDFGEFEVFMFGCCLDPIALLTVNYWQEQY